MTVSILVDTNVCVDIGIKWVFSQFYIIKNFQPYSKVERMIQRPQYTHHLESIIIISLCLLLHSSAHPPTHLFVNLS